MQTNPYSFLFPNYAFFFPPQEKDAKYRLNSTKFGAPALKNYIFALLDDDMLCRRCC